MADSAESNNRASDSRRRALKAAAAAGVTAATWTAPSHYNLLMGLVPHVSPSRVYASEYYKEDYFRYNERLGSDGIDFGKLVPQLYLPIYLQKELGYRTHAKVSLPVLNPATPINRGFGGLPPRPLR